MYFFYYSNNAYHNATIVQIESSIWPAPLTSGTKLRFSVARCRRNRLKPYTIPLVLQFGAPSSWSSIATETGPANKWPMQWKPSGMV